MKVKCPNCGKRAEYEGNVYRPFCSERCRLVDLGKWFNEEYRIPVKEENPELKEESELKAEKE